MPGIIKTGATQAPDQTSLRQPYFHLEDFERRGEEYTAKIRAHAAQIVAKAHAEAESIRQSTVAKAREESLTIVRKEMQQELEKKLAAVEPLLHSALTQLGQQLETWRQEWENRTVGLAVGIAKKVTGHQLQVQPEIVLTQIEAALRLAGKEDRIEIRVHPLDQEAFGSTIEKMIQHFSDLTATTVVSDESVTRGGCLLRTRYGDIDTQLATQIERIGEELS